MLQLQTIYESIKHLYQKEDLETIQHHYFAPWEKNIPYEGIISKLSKEEETKEHLKIVSQNPANSILIYTDASSNATKESVGVGIGIIVKTPPSPSTHYEKKNIGTEQLVYNGELEGATMAVEYAARKARLGLNFHIFSDNQAGLWRLKTPSDNPGQDCQIRAIKAARKAKLKGATVTLHWVPGHRDIEGNERADILAKGATLIRSTNKTMSFAMLGFKIKQIKTTEWKRKLQKDTETTHQYNNPHSYRKQFRWCLKSKLMVIADTPRKTAGAFYQLKIGHGYIKSYLYNIGHAVNDRCSCGAKETAEHLLLSCPKEDEEEQD
jgi:ribonuclease HI